MNEQDRFSFPEPLGEEPRRFTPLLAVAAVVGALAVLAIVYVLFFSGGGTPRPSPSGSPTAPGLATPTPTGSGPSGTPRPGESATAGPTLTAGVIADELCAEPRPPFDALRLSLIEGFREYCLESVAAVFEEEAIDPNQAVAAGWAFAGAASDIDEGAGLSRVFVQVGDERRVRMYLVAHGDADTTISDGPTRVPRIEDDMLVFDWARTGG